MDPTSEKASYKEIHLPLGVVGVCKKGAFGQLCGGGSARQRAERICKKRPPMTRDWTHNGEAVESDCRGPANLQLEGCGRNSTHAVSTSPGMRRVGASSAARPAPSQTPRPIRPFLRGSAPLGRAEAHCLRAPAPAPRLWENVEFKKPERSANPAKKREVSDSSLQERRVKQPTSLEKLCGKLGGSAE